MVDLRIPLSKFTQQCNRCESTWVVELAEYKRICPICDWDQREEYPKPVKVEYSDEYKKGWLEGARDQCFINMPVNKEAQRRFKHAKPPWKD